MNLRPAVAILAATILLAAFAAAPSTAAACSCAWVPHWGFLADANGPMPKNATGLLWHGDQRPELKDFAVSDLAPAREGKAAKPTPVPFELLDIAEGLWMVHPTGGLTVGHTYRFATSRYSPFREGGTLDGATKMSFLDMTVVDEELRLTDKDLKLEVAPVKVDLLRVSRGASCSDEVRVPQAALKLVLPEAAEKFRQLLVFSTLIDGASGYSPRASICSRVPVGRSWTGVGQDLVFAGCGQDKTGVAEGKRSLAMQAVFYPAEPKAATTPAVLVEFSCKDATPPVRRGVRFP